MMHLVVQTGLAWDFLVAGPYPTPRQGGSTDGPQPGPPGLALGARCGAGNGRGR